MATRLENHRERLNALSMLGKDLARRAKSRCELCDEGGRKLATRELPPAPEWPEVDRCLMVCEACTDAIERPKAADPNYWRCLNNSVWSETPVVKASAIRLLRSLNGVDWAGELLEMVYIDEDLDSLVNESAEI